MSTASAMQPEPAGLGRPLGTRHQRPPRPPLTSVALLFGAWGVLLAAPLAFGAVEPWAVLALEGCSSLLLAAWAVRQCMNGAIVVRWHALYPPMAAFFLLGLMQWAFGSTAYRFATYSHLLLYCAYGMLAFVVTQTLRRSSQFEMLAQTLSLFGGLLAAFAVLQGLAPNGKIYWVRELAQGGYIYGSYVNHNHYAGLMEMLTPFPLVLAATRFTHGARQLVAAAIAAVMAGSVFLSGSRGGMAAFVAQMAVFAVLLLLRRGENKWRQPLLLGAFLAAVIVFLVWMGGNELTRRLVSIHADARQELNGGVRLSIDRDCLRMWWQRPILGWGLGAFPVVYPQFRSFYAAYFVNQAHNDYLQLLVETGLMGIGIGVWFLVAMFRRASAKLADWTETATGAMTMAALLGCVGVLVHSLLDFNLQVPANAALFYVLCALAAAEPLRESKRRRVLERSNLIMQPLPRTERNSDQL